MGLIEIMMAIAILGIIAATLSSVLKFVGTATTKARQQTYASNFSQRFFTRLNNIPYQYVFACDSSSNSFGLTGTFGPVTNQTASYPYLAAFNDMRTLMNQYKFDRFTLSIQFMVRDLSDVNGDGRTTDLRAYLDANGDGYDDYEGASSTSALRYNDQNTDGDFKDTYFTTSEITEEPHTRLKEAVLKVYKAGEVVFQETRLISWEKFTGAEGKAAGATLRILVSTPSENSSVYSLSSAAQQTAFNINLSSPYPSDIAGSRADAASPMRIIGETTPDSTLSWKLQTATNAVLDTCNADISGLFDCTGTNVTTNLQEGLNTLWGQATKTVYYSPWSPTTFIRDINPPIITSATPNGTTYNLQPTIRAYIADQPVTAGRDVSGIHPDTVRLFRGTVPVNFQYDTLTGYVTWIDSTTNLIPVLTTGTYTLVAEAADNAFYKARTTWTFTLDASDFTDNSAPSVSHKDPSGIAPSNPPTISCRVFDNQSGIILNSVVMKLDGTVVVSSAVGNLGSAYSPLSQQDGGTVTYQPADVLSSGWHTVTIIADHWATDPVNKINTTESWNFNVP